MLSPTIILQLGNVTQEVGEKVSNLSGNWGLIIGAAVLIVAFFIVIFMLKNIIVNAIIGIIALLIIKFVLGVPIPLNGLVILVAILGGLGGVAAILLAGFFGWL